MRRRSSVRGGLLLCVLALLPACGGDGPAPAGEPLDGRIETADFVLPAGETRLVSSGLTIVATGTIELLGRLNVVPGAGVELSADGDVVVAGGLGPVPGAARRARDEGSADVTLGGANVTIRDFPVQVPTPGGSLRDHVESPQGTIRVAAQVSTSDGADAADRTDVGHAAGDIHLGTAFAVQSAVESGRPGATTPRTIRLSSSLLTGHGGDGWSDTTGRRLDGAVLVEPTFGGDAGSILAQATEQIDATGATLRAGHGGRGGNAGPLEARDGTADGEAGENAVQTGGSGGFGGSVLLFATTVLAPATAQPGDGGDAGDVTVGAGDGGPGGPGGETNLHPTSGGLGGSGLGDAVGRTGRTAVVIVRGAGNGGAGRRLFQNGGPGGRIVLDASVSGVRSLLIEGSSNGGHGFSGCGATPPQPGSNGGRGGDLNLTIAGALVPQVVGSCRGGNAGDGQPPGVRGQGGTDTAGNTYPDGQPGAPCPEVRLGLLLGVDLFYEGQRVASAGETIPLDEIEGGHVADPDVGCEQTHYHSSQGIFLRTTGPIPDPRPTSCGYGEVVTLAARSTADR